MVQVSLGTVRICLGQLGTIGNSPPPPVILKEDGFSLLLENGDEIRKEE